MQTFLPYPDFAESASVLDMRRLGKQRVESLQIVLGLTRLNLDGSPKEGKTWGDHVIGRMWDGHLHALLEYQRAICGEWTGRGYRDTCLGKTETALERAAGYLPLGEPMLPRWLGDYAFHLAHQSNLVRKDPAFYGPQFPGVPDDLPYIWPRANAQHGTEK